MAGVNKVTGSLIGVDGNAFSLLGHFSQLARRQGFDTEFIDSVKKEAMSGDYDHLIETLSLNLEEGDERS